MSDKSLTGKDDSELNQEEKKELVFLLPSNGGRVEQKKLVLFFCFLFNLSCFLAVQQRWQG